MKSVVVNLDTTKDFDQTIILSILNQNKQLKSRVSFSRGDSRIDGNSFLELLLLFYASKGDTIKIQAEGEDEQDAIAQLSEVFSANGHSNN